MSQSLCSNCQTTNRATAKFCRQCGAALLPTRPSPTPNRLQSQDSPSRPPAISPGLGTGRLPPQSFLADRYVVTKKVGQGGMGAVYKALDTRITDQICAIKEMSDAALSERSEKQRAVAAFQREADLLARLRHRNLPRVTDKFELDDRHFLVMEFIEGETLHQKLARGEGPFPEPTVVDWARQLCDVLGYLHSQHPPIVFRDIKPDNIMVDRAGRIKLIDFGIVRFFKAGKNKDTTLLGTPGYAPPEQYGSGQTDARSDVYSLGATLLHLVTGADPGKYPPYQLPPARQINPSVSPAMEQVIARAVQSDPDRRWQSMAAMERALPAGDRRTASTGTMETPTTTTPQRTSRPTTRLLLRAAGLSNRQLALFGGIALILIMLGTWFLTPILQQYPEFWHNVPSIALIGPLAYAAARRRWVTGIAQAITAILGGAVIRLSAGLYVNYVNLLVGAFLSGAIVEGMVAFLPRVTGGRGRDDPGAWQREIAWMAAMAIAGHVALSSFAVSTRFAFNPLTWLSAAVLGALGWFIGDLIYGYVEMRQTGIQGR